MKSLLLILEIHSLISTVSLVFADVIVNLPNGQVRGHESKTAENKTFFGFQGIPYAAPPVGSLRFQAPVPVENWDGIWDATKDRPNCINRSPFTQSSESEDCLFVNVYTPKLNSNRSTEELLPVLFWIYGGAFNSGTSVYSLYGPDYLVQEDIVFVSFNYRVGPFGFLSTEDNIVPGNAGLKDQNLALKWTYQNIHLFGGDPEKITIFGQSAGSASVIYHLLSDKSAGLFRAAIGQSGTALSLWALNRNPKDYALQLLYNIAETNNLVIDNSTLTSMKILEIITNQSSEVIAQADKQILNTLLTVPCIEIPHEGAFLTESSFELLENGKFNQIPTIMGLNSEEYLFFIESLDNFENIAKNLDQNLESLIPTDLTLQNTTNKTKLAEDIKSIYLDSNQLFADNLGAALKYASDDAMTRSIIKHATLQSKWTDLYFYQFSYHGNLGMLQNYNISGALGTVGHFEEVPYLFKMVYGNVINTTDLTKFSTQDVSVEKQIIKLWTNFAKYLNPTPDVSDLLQNVTWPSIKNREFQYLNIGENLELVTGYPRGNSYTSWNTIYNTYGVKPFYTF